MKVRTELRIIIKIPAAGICDYRRGSFTGSISAVSDGTGRKHGSGWNTGNLCAGKFCLWICGRQRNKKKEAVMGNGSRCVLLSVSLTGVSMFRWNSVWTGAAFDDFCPVSGWWNAGGNPVLKMERVLQF